MWVAVPRTLALCPITPPNPSSFSSPSFSPLVFSAPSSFAPTPPPPPLRASSSPRISPTHPSPPRRAPGESGAGAGEDSRRQHKALLVETFHQSSTLRALLRQLSRKGSDPLRMLRRDGDWTSDQLWAAVAFLAESGRSGEALQVFDYWKNNEIARINEANYSRIIRFLCERSFTSEAVSAFQDMKSHDLIPSLAIYNAIIHGFAREKKFDEAIATLEKISEVGLPRKSETYNGLIQAYGSHKMYDDMSKCVKRMESDGCFPDEVTYNILITEFARGGLIERVERTFRTLLSKRMNLQPSTLVAMLEAYTDLEILEKMEKAYNRVLKTKAFLKESLIRKLAKVYIKNHRFSCLEDLGNDIGGTVGRNDLVWCILLLSSACCLSRKGIDSVVREMEVAKAQFSITFANILAHFYLKMKDFRALDVTFMRARKENIKPDIVTIGILFDACKIGYDGTRVLEEWVRNGYLQDIAQMRTNELVLTAFGKGFFLIKCEKLYSSLESDKKRSHSWRYCDLISLAFSGRKTGGQQPGLNTNKYEDLG
ncbi:pentatricopeptide repeat-containing protein At4g14190, chloroplastic [Ananas comosus]|uniref:Pentatricopeptide repeat-containing protein At4g14190, chloroplastic n=1 Tax=Ananas comosus TaxID=4615 RepID=A0A6P5GZC2_ANACO|nr:pentatricopeptide repeat-containing protein At4g14190, chloroplastic [Ananas comosus]XP_020113168.1 pentatricopeptide repeat-containing protein At4g14190, chloroplastic [Ananas comosus]